MVEVLCTNCPLLRLKALKTVEVLGYQLFMGIIVLPLCEPLSLLTPPIIRRTQKGRTGVLTENPTKKVGTLSQAVWIQGLGQVYPFRCPKPHDSQHNVVIRHNFATLQSPQRSCWALRAQQLLWGD